MLYINKMSKNNELIAVLCMYTYLLYNLNTRNRRK